jgi:4-hydroxybenzoate polyprenyltransferase
MKNGKAIALVLGVIAGGLSYWFNPYNVLEIFGAPIHGVMAVGSLVAAGYAAWKYQLGIVQISLMVSLGVAIAVMCRVIVDGLADSTSHNLFPFELALAFVVSFPSALIGASASQFIIGLRKAN